MLLPIHLVSFLWLLSFSPSGEISDSLTVTVDLIDGSHILGAIESHSFPFKTPYGVMQIPFSNTRSIEFKGGKESVQILFENGDQLRGTWDLETLPLRTLMGKKSIPVSAISRISMGRSSPPHDALLHYTFDNVQSGKIRDESGNGYDGILHGEMTPPGHFTGTGVYVECVETPAITDAFTVVASFVPSKWADPRGGGIISKKVSDLDNGFVVYSDSFFPTKLNVRLRGDHGGAPMLHSRSSVDLNVSQNWTVSYDATAEQVRIYKNGSLDTAYTNVDAGNLTDTAPLCVGHSQTWGGFFVGMMHEIILFNRALSDEDVKQVSAHAY